MSFLGRIFYGFLYFDFIGLGAPLSLFLILENVFLLTVIFNFLFSWDVLSRMDF